MYLFAYERYEINCECMPLRFPLFLIYGQATPDFDEAIHSSSCCLRPHNLALCRNPLTKSKYVLWLGASFFHKCSPIWWRRSLMLQFCCHWIHDNVMTRKQFPHYWRFMSGIHRCQWQTVQQTVELFVIWSAMTLMQHHCNAFHYSASLESQFILN